MDAIDESCVQAVVTEASLVAGEGSDARYHLALTVGDAHADGDVWIDAYFFEYSSPLLRSLVSVVPRSKEIFENLRKLNTSEAKPLPWDLGEVSEALLNVVKKQHSIS
ncbi:MAG: hypothetical protein KDB82_04670 [Planctomycetes bacterium]|nr:hypothetical protein [Planctomycetota bacterium]